MSSELKEKLTIRLSTEADTESLKNFLLQPNVLRYFPMDDVKEVEDAARIWIGYSKYATAFTADWEGVPCGFACLYLQPFKKLSHQCLFGIIVDEKYRGRGVGKALIEEITKAAVEKFNIELLHLEVYEGNPARRLYERMGFEEYGKQRAFIKDQGVYIAKIFMQKKLEKKDGRT